MQTYLRKIAEAQVGVLQQDPLALHGGDGHVLAGDDLLTLPHADTKRLDLLALGQVLNELGRVSSCIDQMLLLSSDVCKLSVVTAQHAPYSSDVCKSGPGMVRWRAPAAVGQMHPTA